MQNNFELGKMARKIKVENRIARPTHSQLWSVTIRRGDVSEQYKIGQSPDLEALKL